MILSLGKTDCVTWADINELYLFSDIHPLCNLIFYSCFNIYTGFCNVKTEQSPSPFSIYFLNWI